MLVGACTGAGGERPGRRIFFGDDLPSPRTSSKSLCTPNGGFWNESSRRTQRRAGRTAGRRSAQHRIGQILGTGILSELRIERVRGQMKARQSVGKASKGRKEGASQGGRHVAGQAARVPRRLGVRSYGSYSGQVERLSRRRNRHHTPALPRSQLTIV